MYFGISSIVIAGFVFCCASIVYVYVCVCTRGEELGSNSTITWERRMAAVRSDTWMRPGAEVDSMREAVLTGKEDLRVYRKGQGRRFDCKGSV